MTPTDREAKIAAALAHLCNCYDDHMIAVRNGYSPEEVERRAERYRRAEAEATTLMREPAPDGKALRALRDWACEHSCATDCGDAVRFRPLLREIDRLTSAPVADAEVEALRADMLAVAQQVGIVYEAEGHAPVAGPTPAILRAITKMQRDAGDADQLRSAGLSLRAENEWLRTAADGFSESVYNCLVAAGAPSGDINAMERAVNAAGTKPSHFVAAEFKKLREALAAAELERDDLREEVGDKGFSLLYQERDELSAECDAARAENARLQTDLAAARADQAAMAREQLTAVLGEVVANYETRWDRDIEIRWCPQRWLRTYITTRLAALPKPKPAAEPVPELSATVNSEIAALTADRDKWKKAASELCPKHIGGHYTTCPVCHGVRMKAERDEAVLAMKRHKLTAALPPLPIDEGCVAKTVEAAGDEQCSRCGARSALEAEKQCKPIQDQSGDYECPGEDLWDETHAALRATLTAAIPPLPIDEGRVREAVEAAGDEVLLEFIQCSRWCDSVPAIAELCRRALAGKEPQP